MTSASPAIPGALLDALRDARHVCVLTGAGVSAESGVPTFRDAQEGLWATYRPEDLATPEAFLADPALVWRWYRWRRDTVSNVKPNPGHYALARLAKQVPQLTLITQNVDNLHQRAGNDELIEFHGNIFEDRCCEEGTLHTGDDSLDVPTCPDCGSPLRPGVVWFGEAIPEEALARSWAAAANCDVFLSIGTSSLVYPAAGLADVAGQHGALRAEVNPNPTLQASSFDFALAGKSGVILPELVELLAL
jgi:NAD-dependent deacetylase